MCSERFASQLMNRSRSFLLILALALALRAAWAAAVPVQPLSDGHAYDVLAQNIWNGTGYGWLPGEPTAYWAPGTPFVYAFLFFIFGHTYTPIVILNLLLGVFVVAAAMQLAAGWFNPRVGLLTGVVLALWLNLIEFTTILASELLFCALLLGALLAWTHPVQSWQRRAIGAGVLLAAACYVRPVALALPLVFFILEWLRARKNAQVNALKSGLGSAVLLVVVMALVIAPWSVRNTLTFGHFILLTTNGGGVFWSGNNPNSNGASMDMQPTLPSDNMSEQDAYLTARALAYIGAHPLAFGAGIVEKIVLTHSRESIGIAWNQAGLERWGNAVILALKIANSLFWFPVFGLALAGIGILLWQNGWRALVTQPVILLWAYFALAHAVILAQDRYHIPSIPAIAMLAAYTSVYLYDARRVRGGMRVALAHENLPTEC